MGKVDKDHFIDIDPVAVVDGTNREAIVDAISSAISKGNTLISIAGQKALVKSVATNHTDRKTFARFAKNTLCWKISNQHSSFEVCRLRKCGVGVWEDDPGDFMAFAAAAPINEIAEALAGQILGKV